MSRYSLDVLEGPGEVKHDSGVRSSDQLGERGSGQLALSVVFVLIALASLFVGLVGFIAWGLSGFGVDAATLLCGAVVLLGLGVEGARRTLRGDRPWGLLMVAALVFVVLGLVDASWH
jgi:hypothetical protein